MKMTKKLIMKKKMPKKHKALTRNNLD